MNLVLRCPKIFASAAHATYSKYLDGKEMIFPTVVRKSDMQRGVLIFDWKSKEEKYSILLIDKDGHQMKNSDGTEVEFLEYTGKDALLGIKKDWEMD